MAQASEKNMLLNLKSFKQKLKNMFDKICFFKPLLIGSNCLIYL